MKKYQFLLLVFLLLGTNNIYPQSYFNYRFEYDQIGVWDGAMSVLQLPDGYIIGGVAATGTNNDNPRIGFYKIDFLGNKIFSKMYGNAMWYIGDPGSIIRFNDTLIVVSGSRKNFQDGEYNEGLLFFMTDSFDTLFMKIYGDKVNAKDTCYILNQLKKTESNQIITVGARQLCGYYNKVILINTTNQGDILWEKSYGEGADFQGFSVICTSDGGYAVGGFTWTALPPPNNSGDPVVIKTDSAGNQQWLKTLGGPFKDDLAMVCNAQDGNIIVGMSYCDSMSGGGFHTTGIPFRRINIIKMNNSGTILWDKKYGRTAYQKTLVNIHSDFDGTLTAVGITHHSEEYSAKELGWILKTTSDGDSLWYREYAV